MKPVSVAGGLRLKQGVPAWMMSLIRCQNPSLSLMHCSGTLESRTPLLLASTGFLSPADLRSSVRTDAAAST